MDLQHDGEQSQKPNGGKRDGRRERKHTGSSTRASSRGREGVDLAKANSMVGSKIPSERTLCWSLLLPHEMTTPSGRRGNARSVGSAQLEQLLTTRGQALRVSRAGSAHVGIFSASDSLREVTYLKVSS